MRKCITFSGINPPLQTPRHPSPFGNECGAVCRSNVDNALVEMGSHTRIKYAQHGQLIKSTSQFGWKQIFVPQDDSDNATLNEFLMSAMILREPDMFSANHCLVISATMCVALTVASWSKRPNSSLSSLTSCCALHSDDRTVKPTMSANRMLRTENTPESGLCCQA